MSFLLSVFNIFFGFFALIVHWSTVTGGICIGRGTPGMVGSFMAWCNFQGRFGAEDTEYWNHGGWKHHGVSQVAWSGEKKLLLYRRKAKKRDTTLSSEGNDQSAGNGSIKTNWLGLCFLSSSLVKCQAGLKQSKEEEESFWKKEKKKRVKGKWRRKKNTGFGMKLCFTCAKISRREERFV